MSAIAATVYFGFGALEVISLGLLVFDYTTQ